MSFRTLDATRGRLRSCAAGRLAAIFASASLAGWAALIVAIVALLAFDLFFAHRGEDEVSLRRAAGWSVWWMAVGVAFALVVLALIGSAEAGSYLAGFLMEKALSLDNVFVIAVLLGTFAVPQALKADVLTFGIAVALMLRTVFIFAGVTLLELFHPVLYVMGALLVFTGVPPHPLQRHRRGLRRRPRDAHAAARAAGRQGVQGRARSSSTKTAAGSRRRCWPRCSRSRSRT